jgi:uncharacterized protein YjbI with pentapeptide repeats
VKSTAPAPPRLPTSLAPLSASARRGDDYLSEQSVSGDFTGLDREEWIVERSRIVDARLVAATLHRLRATDVVIANTDLSGADLDESVLNRVVFKDCRMSGVILSRCTLRDVLFVDCRLDDASFRMGEAKAVRFEDVDLRRGDFYAALLEGTRFFDCDLTGAQFAKARTAGVRFHGSNLTDLQGGSDLAGAVIDSSQVLSVAMGVLSALGIRVDDEREPTAALDPKVRPRP